MIKVSIIEDEPEIRKLLRKIIERQEGFQVVSESGDFAEAVTDFTKYRPEVIFVDIDLNGQSGLECAKVLTELNPKLKVIFATAHSEYMANAFEIYAFDYLVKPFNMERVIKTLTRIKSIFDAGHVAGAVSPTEKLTAAGSVLPTDEATVGTVTAESVVSPADAYKDKLMIKGKDQVTLIDKKDIIMVERCDNSTNIVTKDEVFKTSVALTGIEEKLNPSEFMRCHKSYIINISMVTQIEPYGRWTYVVKLKGSAATALMTAQNYEVLKSMFA